MKRSISIFLSSLFSFNLGALILNLKDFGIEWNFYLVFCIHYEASVYALKIAVIGVIIDWFSKDLFDKKDK